MRFQRNRNNNHRFNRGRRGPVANGAVLSAIRNSTNSRPVAAAVEQPKYIAKNSFSDFAISPKLKENIKIKNYGQPTPIQDQAIPHILAGRDVIGLANTGTGKTAAFLIPIINKMAQDKRGKTLIVAPTRELAVQIAREAQDFSRGLGVYTAMIIGGVSTYRQEQDLRRGAQIVIGTPGRLKDLIKRNLLDLKQFGCVVLDEADRMVDIGFIGDIKYFISLLPTARQSLFFSATISGKVAGILENFVVNPVTVSVARQNTTPNVTQSLIEVGSGKQKIDSLHDLLIKKEFEKVLIFGRTKWGIEKLTKELVARGFKAGSIHGNKRQQQRQRTLAMFSNNLIQILLATDVASRGLDINDVSHVINYDIPQTYEDYVHRIGRTGRADKRGTALTFVEKNQ